MGCHNLSNLLQENTGAKSTGDPMWACVGPQCTVGVLLNWHIWVLVICSFLLSFTQSNTHHCPLNARLLMSTNDKCKKMKETVSLIAQLSDETRIGWCLEESTYLGKQRELTEQEPLPCTTCFQELSLCAISITETECRYFSLRGKGLRGPHIFRKKIFWRGSNTTRFYCGHWQRNPLCGSLHSQRQVMWRVVKWGTFLFVCLFDFSTPRSSWKVAFSL